MTDNPHNCAAVSMEGHHIRDDDDLCVHCRTDLTDQLWLIQDTRQIVGNCILWWSHEAAGYTTELKDAGRFTESFAKSQRESDHPIPLSIAKMFTSTHVRADTGIRTALGEHVCPRCGRWFGDGISCAFEGCQAGRSEIKKT